MTRFQAAKDLRGACCSSYRLGRRRWGGRDGCCEGGAGPCGRQQSQGTADQPGRVGVLIREVCGRGILVCQRDNCETILEVDKTGGLGPKQRNNLDVVASAGLVAEGFESDSGTGGGAKGTVQ
jgi:hypothetical protein